jgi:hypothetical protein
VIGQLAPCGIRDNIYGKRAKLCDENAHFP